jgi:uncharacterized membrane protein YphA (DoxX/SURF4 family)
MEDSRITQAWWALRAAFGVVPVVAGLDKFFNLLTNWEQYLSPVALRVVPLSGGAFMHVIGLVEIAVGVMILTKWTRLGAYVAAGWLLSIAVNLLLTGHFFDVAARDVTLAVAAFALGRLQEVHAEAGQRGVSSVGSTAHA